MTLEPTTSGLAVIGFTARGDFWPLAARYCLRIIEQAGIWCRYFLLKASETNGEFPGYKPGGGAHPATARNAAGVETGSG